VKAKGHEGHSRREAAWISWPFSLKNHYPKGDRTMTEQGTITLDIEGARRFHGHSCPGLAIGIRVAEIALREIGPHSADEEVVAIVESDNCAVDAIQYLTGCTFGKGNLIHRDYGKNAFTFIRRSDGKAVRIVLRPDAGRGPSPEQGGEQPEDRIQALLERPLHELFDVQDVRPELPAYAPIHDSVICSGCGEKVMETRARLFHGALYCIPCFQSRERQR
jgi:formylmethanofuran dehydrogenase subunit E